MTQELVERLLAGNTRAIARALTHVENGTPAGYEILRDIYARAGRAQIIGITGPAGSGKSTLAGAVAREERRRGRTVAVLAVDPSSPYTQGALLGDRIRMQDLTSDPGVFVRSMATRGSLGGLAETAGDLSVVLDAAGYDVIILETVGAGQDEVEVADAAQTTIVVNTPGMGDSIQALKAGILEIANILVVNKADRPGADALEAELGTMLGLAPDSSYRPPILRTVASTEEGVVELVDAIDAHRAQLDETGALERGAAARAKRDVLGAARAALMRTLVASAGDSLDGVVSRVASRETDPHTAARELIGAAFPGCAR